MIAVTGIAIGTDTVRAMTSLRETVVDVVNERHLEVAALKQKTRVTRGNADHPRQASIATRNA
jgi:hypothetical protein